MRGVRKNLVRIKKQKKHTPSYRTVLETEGSLANIVPFGVEVFMKSKSKFFKKMKAKQKKGAQFILFLSAIPDV